ncbi:hypothetical protein [Bacteroides sp.]|uniref:hypothetical protein n=1 Tax=Bacteroides sp. TaxID=29523 RepID=UPI002629E5D7|nr:hypothetical protein [Bacteroides sp.]
MRAARLFLILLTICLLASCRNNPAHNDSRYTPLAQVLKQAQTALKDGDSNKTFGIIESSFFPQLPQQSSDNSIHAMIREAMSTYFSSVKTGKHIARCLHFYDSLVAVIPPHSLLDGYRSDIYANSSFCRLPAWRCRAYGGIGRQLLPVARSPGANPGNEELRTGCRCRGFHTNS